MILEVKDRIFHDIVNISRKKWIDVFDSLLHPLQYNNLQSLSFPRQKMNIKKIHLESIQQL